MQRIKVLLYFAVMIAGVVVLYKLFPPYMANFTFQDDLKNTVVRLQNGQSSDEEIKAAVLAMAQEKNLPVTEQQIQVIRQGKSLTVTVNYEVHVDLPGYPLDLQFSPSTTNSTI